jgi:DNA-binding beta-propeller fold protein YncE
MRFQATRIAAAFAMGFLPHLGSATEEPLPAPPPELLGHWTFDSDTRSSVGGWTGQLQGGALAGQPGAAVGTGSYRNGAGEGFLQTDLVALASGTPQAVSLWIKTDATTGEDDALFGWGIGGFQAHYDVGLKGANLHFLLERNSATFTLPNPLNSGGWHHLLISREAAGLSRHTIYLDGKSVGSPTKTFGGGTATPIRIGTGFQRILVHNGPPERDFNGSLDDFAYFGSALAASDAALIHGLAKLGGTNVAGIQPARMLAMVPPGAVAEVGGRLWTTASGLPGTTGDFGGSVEAGDASIALNEAGGGIRMLPAGPPPTSSPLVLEGVAATVTVRSGERASFPLQLRNSGAAASGWKLRVVGPAEHDSALESVLGRFSLHSPQLLGSLPPQRDFNGGVTGTRLDSDPFENGNVIETNLGGPIPYSDGLLAASTALGPNGRYFTLKLPGLFLFAGDADGPNLFKITNSMLRSFSSQSRAFNFTHAGRTWRAFAVRRTSSWTPYMVNELFLIDDPNADMDAVPGHSSSGWIDRYHFTGKRRVYRAFFTDAPAGDEPWTPFEKLARTMLDLQSDAPPGASLNPASGSLAEGATAASHLEIDALQMLPGSYPLTVDAQPAGGGAEAVRAPVNLQVGEPAIRLGATAIDRAVLTGGPQETVGITTQSSLGSEQTWTARLLNAGSWVTLLTPSGTTPQTISLQFTPDPSQTGLLRATLEVKSGDSTYLIPITYAVDSLRPTHLVMDPLRDRAYVLCSGSYGGMVVVMHPARNSVTRVIRVGRGPSDLAFSPNGSDVYVLSAIDLEIARIDPVTMEVTSRRQVPGTAFPASTSGWPSARLAVGSNGRIYYTDTTFNPPLRMLDFQTGEVLDTLTFADIPRIFTTQSAGFGDLFFDPLTEALYFTRNRGGFSMPPRVGRVNTDADQLTFSEEWTAAGNLSGISSWSRIRSDLNGRRLHVDRLVFDLANLSNGQVLFDSAVTDISAYGDLVMTSAAIHDAVTGQKLVDLPMGTELAAFTRNQAGVYYYVSFGQFAYWPLPEAIRPPPMAIRPEPPNGGAIEVGDNTLRWSSLPQVDGYRIYLGTSAAAVAAAQPGAPEDRGVVRTNSFSMDPVPDSSPIFWRVDALRGDAVVPGTVFSFSVAPFRVTPREVEVIAPHGARPQRVTLAATNAEGEPVAWSASSASPWITLPRFSGGAGEPLLVDLNPAGLALGSHSGALRVTGAGLTLEIPMVLQLFTVDLYRLRADPNRSVVYGLQTGQLNGLPGYIIAIDAATGDYLSAIPLDEYATDFAIHPHEGRLYVPLSYYQRIQVFDLASGAELPSIPLDSAPYQIGSVTAGRAGRLFVDTRPSFSGNWTTLEIDTATGEIPRTIDRGFSLGSQAVIASDPSGRFLYRESGRKIQRVDVLFDPPQLLESGESDLGADYSWDFSNLAVSRDGSRILANKTVFTADLRRLAPIESDAHAISSDGQVVAGPTGLFWAASGHKIANLPVTVQSFARDTSRVVISSDDRFIVMWDEPLRRTLSVSLASLVSLPGPTPVPGSQLTESPGVLGWAAVPGATAYQVFLGTNQAAVNAASFSSPLRIGTATTNSLALPAPLAVGYRYYWRVDALSPSGMTKGTPVFFELPFQPNGNPIIQRKSGSSYGSSFGRALAAGPDGLLVTESPGLKWYDFDWASGDHRLVQEIANGAAFMGSSDGALGAGEELLISGNPGFNEPSSGSGAVFIHRPFQGGQWQRTVTLPGLPAEPVQHFGRQLAIDANQLLVQQGSNWHNSGRVFPYFEWPDWHRGPELIPNPKEPDDFFGAVIALDGTRALIGAPGAGTNYERRGFAFMFEFDAPGRRWLQAARLQPTQGEGRDHIGLSAVLSGNHAALGSGNYDGTFQTRKVHVFNRRSATSWVESETLEDPSPSPGVSDNSGFGKALVISGDLLFVSAPMAEWRGQRGGVVYVYRYNGTGWDAMAPIVPPLGSSEFGSAMTVRNGWLFVSRFQPSTSNLANDILVYRIGETTNRQPRFITKPPVQLVVGKPVVIEVEADDPDGLEGLLFPPASLPPGLTLEDLGNGRARITGTPTDPADTERWLRIAVADVHGIEAVQTSQITLVAGNELPVLGGLPELLEIIEGEELVIAPTLSGSGPFMWEWRREGVVIGDAGGPSLVIPGMRSEDAGRYTVTVTNVVGSVTSDEIAIRVRPADRFAGDWTSYGSGNNHDGYQSATLGRHTFQAAWQTAAQPGYGLNPVAVASGRVFVTPRNFHNAMESRAYDLATGALAWSHPFARARSLNSPTWHGDRIFLQRNDTSNSEMWCLNAITGAPVWSFRYSNVSSNDGTPVADASGIFAAGGYGSGVYGFEPDGSQRFYRTRSEYTPWMPTLANGRLFTWDGSLFTELDVTTGTEIWTLDRRNSSKVDGVPVISGSRAYLLEFNSTLCVDVNTRQVVWEIPRRFLGAPAFGLNRLFVLSGTVVVALSPDDGSQVAQYGTGTAGNRPLPGQPLVLNDHLITATQDQTLIFHLATGELVQTIPHGGHLAYSGGYLLIAGADGVLRAYFANAAPEFAEAMPAVVPAGADAGDVVLPLGGFAGDADPDDLLVWSIKSVSRPELFRTLEIDATGGDLTVIYNPWQSGTAEVTLAVKDPAGNLAEQSLTFTVPEHPEPQLALAARLSLNRQTGLYEQVITVTNSGPREIAGIDLTINDLPPGVAVNNASTRDGNDWIIHHRQPLAAGAAVELVIEYHTPVRGTRIDPKVGVAIVSAPETHLNAPDGGLAVERCVVLPDRSVMVEFTATPGALYEIHYSEDAVDWKLSPIRVRAAGNRVQWIDSGAPRTATPPSAEPCRFYRVREIPES